MTDPIKNATAKEVAEPTELTTIENSCQIHSVRFSPDGAWLAAGCYDGLIRRWKLDGEESTELEPLNGHHGWVQQIALSSRNKSLFSTDSWGMLRAWSVNGDSADITWSVDEAHNGWITDLALSDDEKRLVTSGLDGGVRVWSTVDGKVLADLPEHDQPVYRVAVSPDQTLVATADRLGVIRLWSTKDKTVVAEHELEGMHLYDRIQDVPGVYVLKFEDGGKRLMCAGGQPTRTGNHQGIPTLYELSVPSLKIERKRTFGVEKDGFIFDLLRHPDGHLAMVTSGNPGAGQFLFVSPEDDEPFFKSTKMSNCHSLALHPSGNRMVVAATNRNSQGNGAVRDKDGHYVANTSPLHLFELPQA